MTERIDLMKRLVRMTIFSIGLMLSSESPAAPSACIGNEFQDILVPINHDRPSSRTFIWKVRYINRNSPRTLVVIPGGPGGTSMQGNLSLYPDGFNLLLTDPRTLGCNHDNPPDAALDISSKTLALDIVSAVEQLRLPAIFIYGQSYGTQVGTILASALEKRSLPAEGVVLEGAVGAERDFLDGYNTILHRLLKKLPSKISKKLRSINETQELLGRNSRAWGYFLLQFLPIGATGPNSIGMLEKFLVEGLSEPPVGEGRRVLEYLLDSSLQEEASEDDQSKSIFFLAISCRESFPVIADDFLLTSGTIKPTTGAKNRCSNHRFDRPYDPRDYSLATKIWYLHGSDDPSTPLAGALHHFSSQTKASQRTFLEFKGAGHAVSSAYPECMAQIWKIISEGRRLSNPEELICSSVVKVKTKR